MLIGIHLRCQCIAIGCSLSALACASPAMAQTSSQSAKNDDQIADIIVTARRRPETIQSTPIAISAVTQADIERSGSGSAPDVIRGVPGIQFDVGGGISGNAFTSSIYIRGVGQNEYLSTSDPGVALYVDGVYYARQVGSVFDLTDISSLEILRGPQGTLFGKNAIGGALNVNTAAPADKFSAVIQGLAGSRGRGDTSVSITGALVADRINGKLAVTHRSYNGFGTQFGGVRTNSEDTWIGRGALLFKLTDSFEVTLAADGQTRRETPATQHIVRLVSGTFPDGSANYPTFLWNQLVGNARGTPFGTRELTNSIYTSNSNGGTRANLDNYGGSLTAAYKFSGATLKSITAYRHLNTLTDKDNSASSVGLNTETDVDSQNQFSQELQLTGNSFGNKLHWTGGLYYFRETPNYQNNTVNFPGLYQALQGAFAALGQAQFQQTFGIPAPSVFAVNYNLSGRTEVNSYAAYAQATYDLTDKLSVTAGLRYTNEDKTLTFSQTEALTNTCVLDASRTAAQCVYTVKQRWTDWSPRGDITFKPAQGVLLYASVSKGFKSGGFNGRAQSPDLLTPYNPEQLWAYEVGLKADFWDRRARLNISAYYNDYRDIQLDGSRVSSTGSLQTFTLNGGRARITGVEAELFLKPTSGLTLNGSAAYTDASYKELSCNVIGYFNGGVNLCGTNDSYTGTQAQRDVAFGQQLPRTPRWTYSVGATYDVPLGEQYGSLSLHADYSYRSHVYFEPLNFASSEQDGYGIGNARIGWTDTNGRFTIAGLVSNFTDKQYYVNVFSGTRNANGTVIGNPGRPREWSAQGIIRF
jgi:iron complex outermembrane receptor protein